MGSLEHIRYSTKYLAFLQGLKLVPSGVVLLVAAGLVTQLDLQTLGPRNLLLLTGVAYAISLGGYGLFALHYRRTYGHARQAPEMRTRMLIAMAGTLVGSVLMALSLARLRGHPGPQAAVICIAVALFAGWYWRWSERVLHHYLGAAAVFLMLALVELVLGNPSSLLLGITGARAIVVDLFAASGVFLVVVGLLDHRFLVRQLPSPPEEQPV